MDARIKKLVISYSDDDRERALEIRKSLSNNGYEVWIAKEKMRGSVDWTQTILDAIDSHDGWC